MLNFFRSFSSTWCYLQGNLNILLFWWLMMFFCFLLLFINTMIGHTNSCGRRMGLFSPSSTFVQNYLFGLCKYMMKLCSACRTFYVSLHLPHDLIPPHSNSYYNFFLPQRIKLSRIANNDNNKWILFWQY